MPKHCVSHHTKLTLCPSTVFTPHQVPEVTDKIGCVIRINQALLLTCVVKFLIDEQQPKLNFKKENEHTE